MKGTGAALLFLLGMVLLLTAEAEMTACHKKRQESLNLRQSLKGQIVRYTPDCDERGDYKPVQCSGSTGYCWCVTSNGEKVPGTDTPPGRHGPPNCDSHEMTKCQKEQRETEKRSGKGMKVGYIPDCDEHGDYKPVQCDSRHGYCWCVTSEGVKIFGTDTNPGRPNCDSHGMTRCQKEHKMGLSLRHSSKGMVIGYIPDCDEYGNYKPVQCDISTGYCWCVYSDGVKVSGTETPRGGHLPPNCDSHGMTRCQKERHESLNLRQSLKGKIVRYTPDCDEHGDYKPVQCSGSTGYCWCVTSDGEKVPGTETPPGQHGPPNCDSHGITKCQKERQEALRQQNRIPVRTGIFVPDCDDHGNYEPLQCIGSSGYCWCVTSDGVKIPGTKSPPGRHGPPNCDSHALQKTGLTPTKLVI